MRLRSIFLAPAALVMILLFFIPLLIALAYSLLTGGTRLEDVGRLRNDCWRAPWRALGTGSPATAGWFSGWSRA